MKELTTLLCLVTIPLIISGMCWWLLGKPLRKVLGFLCNDPRPEVKEVSGIFWQRLYLSLTIFIPILCVLLFVPSMRYNFETLLLYTLRWSMLGGVTLLLVLAYLVRKQINVLQQDFHDHNITTQKERGIFDD